MSLTTSVVSVFRKITIVVCVAIAFLFGVVSTVYLSLRSPEVKVPDIVGKNRFDAEEILARADLKFRVRATRPSNQAQPDTVLFQLPRAGEVVKAGQTVAMDVSRLAKQGETPENVKPEEPADNSNSNAVSNAGEAKPRRPRNPNKNTNENGNTNGNANTNANVRRPVNANRSTTNSNVNSNATPHANVNRSTNANSPGNVNQNPVRRPASPRPTPTVPR